MHNAIIATVDTEVSDEEAAQRTFSYIKVSTEAHYDDSKNYVEYTDDEKAELEKTAEKIAEELFLSRPYLSRKFKEETGESLTDFILKEKTEEAKRFLRYSDKSLTAIGSYLGFSSASHFSRVFKTYVGSTPSEYREKHQ